MNPFRKHPDREALLKLATRTLRGASGVDAHVESCERCRHELSTLRALQQLGEDVAEPHAALRDRIVSSRRQGERAIIATAAHAPMPQSTRFTASAWMAIAAALAVVLIGLATTTPEVEASGNGGVMTISPSSPKAGQPIVVKYEAPLLMASNKWLTLRGRLRSKNSDSYATSVTEVNVGRLVRGRNGVFEARVVLPDSIVFAAFAIEDSAAEQVDDNAGRAWEVLVSGPDNKPLYDALDQKSNDLMGRSWEEGMANAKQMVALYPERISAWSLLKAVEGWMGHENDSTMAIHRAKVVHFDSVLRTTKPADDDVGMLAWYSQNLDSARHQYWRDRLMKDAPKQSFAIQWRIFPIVDSLGKTADTTAALQAFEQLYADATIDRREQVAGYAMSLARGRGDQKLVMQWATRAVPEGSIAAQRNLATSWASSRLMREEGLRRVRMFLREHHQTVGLNRRLGETVHQARQRDGAAYRSLLATLGRILVQQGEIKAALDTLRIAAADGWSLDVLQSVRQAQLLAGDTTAAIETSARYFADPQVTGIRDSLAAFATRRIGKQRWDSLVAAGRLEFVERMLAVAPSRPFIGKGSVATRGGERVPLSTLTGDSVTVVMFWSMHCGPAREEIVRFDAIATSLRADGIRVVSIVDEKRESPELAEFVRKNGLATPVLVDADGDASAALNQWGTPSIYVVDRGRRIRFGASSSSWQVRSRAEAVRLSGE